MNVLVACEESQRVCAAFRAKGHKAFSCDIQAPSGGNPEWHIRTNVLTILNAIDGEIQFFTEDGFFHCLPKWDLIIAHPPCTYLTVTGNRWFNVEKYGEKAIEREFKRDHAAEFFMQFSHADCDKIAIENPIGYMNTHYRKPDQIIQPYMFGDHARKSTCLWLKGLPKLVPTDIVDPGKILNNGYSEGAHAEGKINGKWVRFNDPELSKERSKTFPGIAQAMADQWG